MNLRERMAAAASRLGLGRVPVIPIFLGGNGDKDDRARARAEQALRSGARIRLVRFAVGDRAESIEEALALVEAHKAARGEHCPMVVHGPDDMSKVLARWDPPPPVWLQELRAKYQR